MTRREVLLLSSFVCGAFRLGAQTIRLASNSQSELRLEVRKTGLMAGKKHVFLFPEFEGAVQQEPAAVSFTVQVKSLVCKDDWVKPKDREKITRYALDEVLQANRFPRLRYQSTSVQANDGAGGGYLVHGNLTIREATKAVDVHVTRQGSGTETVWTGNAAIGLTDFGIKPPTAALGAIGTEDVMQLSFHLRQAAA